MKYSLALESNRTAWISFVGSPSNRPLCCVLCVVCYVLCVCVCVCEREREYEAFPLFLLCKKNEKGTEKGAKKRGDALNSHHNPQAVPWCFLGNRIRANFLIPLFPASVFIWTTKSGDSSSLKGTPVSWSHTLNCMSWVAESLSTTNVPSVHVWYSPKSFLPLGLLRFAAFFCLFFAPFFRVRNVEKKKEKRGKAQTSSIESDDFHGG